MIGPDAVFPPTVIIKIASLLVPSERREEWIKEWLAELHYARTHAGEAESFAFASGAFRDAIWQQRDFWNPKRTRRLMQSPWFCIGSLTAILVLIIVASGMLPMTRMAVMPLAYRDASRIQTIAESSTISTRSALPGRAVEWWRSDSRTLDGIATYLWESQEVASVSEDFFYVLGAKTAAGHRFDRDAFTCAPGPGECVVVSYDFWRTLKGLTSVAINGKACRIAAVTESGFWFLSPRISVWRMGTASPKTRTGVVARLAADVSPDDAKAELGAILQKHGEDGWDSVVELTGVAGRVRSVFALFLTCLLVATLILVPSLHLRMPKWNPAAVAFFVAKSMLALLAVFLFGIEFTRASSITMLGGSDQFFAVSAWLFVMASAGVLAWSLWDQRQRCRVCLKRLGMAQHVGCSGCLLLDWAGTELVCVEGHGMLHVPEMVACWQEPYRWTSLDETWQELFERS